MRNLENYREWISEDLSQAVRFFGRTESEVLQGKVFFNWSASGFEFTFSGTSAYALLYTAPHGGLPVPSEDERAWIGVYLDGSTEAISHFELDEPEKWYVLAEGLPDAVHTIRVVKLSECGYGRAALSAIKTVGSSPARPTKAKSRRLEFIGDSITCGYGNQCSNQSPKFVTREENAARTYAFFLGQLLDAEVNCICASGNGIYHDYGCQTHNLIPELYKYTDKMLAEHFGLKASLWDRNRYVPDMVVIKLGANDSRYCDGWDLQDESLRTDALKKQRRLEFSDRLYAFLDQVIQSNPDTPVLYLTDSDTILKDTIENTIRSYQAAHPGCKLYSYSFKSKRPWEGVGANGHWATTTHRRVAVVLEPVIREILGW